MSMTYFHVDAFTSRRFGGNPAAVVPLDRELSAEEMQLYARELQLSETAFFTKDLHLRWFTPEVEIDLCGHATLAAAHVLFTELEPGRTHVRFTSRSGALEVTMRERLTLDFPSRPAQPAREDRLAAILGKAPREVLRSRDLVAVLDTAEDVRALTPDFARMAELDAAVSVTAPGTGADGDVDFVSRFFAPREGIPEDPVTGSAHCHLIPLWSSRLGKANLRSRQVSRRVGELWCAIRGDRVEIAGDAITVAHGVFKV